MCFNWRSSEISQFEWAWEQNLLPSSRDSKYEGPKIYISLLYIKTIGRITSITRLLKVYTETNQRDLGDEQSARLACHYQLRPNIFTSTPQQV